MTRAVFETRRHVVEWVLVGLALSALVIWLTLAEATARADNLVYDRWVDLKRGPPSEQIVVVAIDNRSIEALGRWPWPRSTHAALIDRLAQAQARAVGYDVLFTEPDPADPVLAASIKAAGNVYLPVLLETPGDDGAAWSESRPAGLLAEAAAGLGHVNLTPDADGTVRRLPLYMSGGLPLTHEGKAWPHLMARLYEGSGGDLPQAPTLPDQEGFFAESPVLVGYGGPAGHFRTISFADLLNGETPAGFLKDRLVLVGMTADGQGDRYATPTSSRGGLTPGVEIQAALLDTLLRGEGTRPTPVIGQMLLSLMPLWLLLVAFLVFRPMANLAVGMALIAGVFLASLAAFHTGWWFPPLAAVAGLALAWPLWSWRRLAAASSFMQAEIDQFEAEAPLLPDAGRAGLPQDVIARQVGGLRRALQRFRNLSRFVTDTLGSLPDATLVVSDEGRVLLANDRARTLFYGGDPVGAEVNPLFKELGEGDWRRFVQGDEAKEIVTPSGAVLKVDSERLSDADGGASGHIIRLADISAMRMAESQREEALQLLSHDMRAPQVSILTLLEGGHDRADPAFEQRIGDYARRTLTLAESYVQLARAESQALNSAVFDLTQVVIDAADSLWPQANAAGATIVTPDGAVEHLVRGDPVLITRVLVNLIDNALKYGPSGGVVTCALEEQVEMNGRIIVCSIQDDGPGLSETAQAGLFERFVRAEPDKPGVGLGLAFVRTVVERHGGGITCDSGPGRGTTFRFSLPCLDEAD
jgi:CHASE2 domain-containing sensor protein/signal transduction histidine kinase